MTAPGGSWTFAPPVWLGALAAGALFTLALYRRKGWERSHVCAFYGGLATVVVALTSPLHQLGECCSFAAHMVQHQLLLLLAPPLLIWGVSGLLPAGGGGRWRWLAALVMVVNVYLWHWPAFYQAAMRQEFLHEAEHLSFLGTGLWFWWHVVRDRGAGGSIENALWLRVRHLFFAMLAMLPLGLLLLVAQEPLYPLYLAGQGPVSSAAGLMRVMADQQQAALYMLSSGAAALTGGVLFGLLQWQPVHLREERN
jgi:putative membrane protein